MGQIKLHKSVQITLIIVLGIILLASLGFVAFNSIVNTNTVSGQGAATIEAMPDLVSVYFNIETNGDTSKEAKDANSKIVDEFIISLLNQGFEREEIQTQNFNIYPQYDWINGKRIEKGFKATHQIKIELSTQEFDKIGTVIDEGVDSGAAINYINFELSQEKQNQYKAEAIQLAAEDARIKAESMVIGLGKELGKLVSVSDSDFGYSPWRAYSFEMGVSSDQAKEEATSIQPSEQQISARVTAVFKIK